MSSEAVERRRRRAIQSPQEPAAKYLTFEKTGRLPKTDIYTVFGSAIKIGEIRWFAKWRQYSFFPFPNTVFEKQCLKDIAEYLICLNKKHWAERLCQKQP